MAEHKLVMLCNQDHFFTKGLVEAILALYPSRRSGRHFNPFR
jgi:hypothetical protein